MLDSLWKKKSTCRPSKPSKRVQARLVGGQHERQPAVFLIFSSLMDGAGYSRRLPSPESFLKQKEKGALGAERAP